MKIGHGQQFLTAGLHPLLTFMTLTLWTMSIPAAVVAQQDATTIGASIDVPTQSCCATPLDGRKCAQLPAIESELVYLFAKLLEYLRYFEAGAHCKKSVSSGLKARLRSSWLMCKYSMVVSMRSCPSSSLSVMMSSPSSSKCVA
jgi:hypothetical protein